MKNYYFFNIYMRFLMFIFIWKWKKKIILNGKKIDVKWKKKFNFPMKMKKNIFQCKMKEKIRKWLLNIYFWCYKKTLNEKIKLLVNCNIFSKIFKITLQNLILIKLFLFEYFKFETKFANFTKSITITNNYIFSRNYF